jgi:hypothetical protein
MLRLLDSNAIHSAAELPGLSRWEPGDENGRLQQADISGCQWSERVYFAIHYRSPSCEPDQMNSGVAGHHLHEHKDTISGASNLASIVCTSS